MIPPLALGLCDDASVFPPGLMPLADALPAHRVHRAAPYADAVGLLVLPATALDDLPVTEPIDVALTAPGGPIQAWEVLTRGSGMPLRLRALEVAVPDDMTPARFFRELGDPPVTVYVEIPRDARGPEFIKALMFEGHRAKFRTGGVTGALYPSPDELAGMVKAAVDAGVAFKATAGLHHAVRNTDPPTGFEQHGFLNLLLATAAALDDAPVTRITHILADRDASAVAARVADLPADRIRAVRGRFLSFGTCSVLEPLTELADLGLLPLKLLENDT
ncbi:hypothetical protein [Spirillospora albida]|uniref:hypothetical protein n=1 Tax=Spirillospora albida TaxID=58123 RepID=UPI0012FAB0A1|nr:hypothetical protein [Spirillospora albida]